MRRIVFSIAHFLIAATALFLFRLTKSRKTFYVQVECLCFHTAWTQSGHRRETISTSIADGGKAGLCASLRPQLAFQFVEEAPIGVLGDDLLRRRLDQTVFMEAQRVEADRVLGIVFAPSIVGNIVERSAG